jgi:hypothetical protein
MVLFLRQLLVLCVDVKELCGLGLLSLICDFHDFGVNIVSQGVVKLGLALEAIIARFKEKLVVIGL